MNKLFELMLEHRGLTLDDLESFENPEHGDLKDIDKLAERLHDIHEHNSKIVIIPDFDMDGIMSGTVGYAGMSELGFNVELFCPNPQDGYGFGKTQVESIIADFPDTKAIITCDNGISCLEGTRTAVDHGIEVLITDHHIEDEATSPRDIASVIVDPCAIGEEYEHPAICGAHVFWQCLDYYARKYSTPDKVEKIRRIRVFAGVGTISDVMPVLYENRVLIRDALDILKEVWSCAPSFTNSLKDASEPYKQAFRGLYAAYKVFSEKNKVNEIEDVDEQFFGFYMAPTFNAVKRMDGEMEKAFGVFTGKDQFEDMRYLYALNEKRKRTVLEKYREIQAQDNPLAPFCYIAKDARKGILGLLATRFVQDTGMPCVVVIENEDGSYSGSGRSPEWFPFISTAGAAGYRVAGHEGAFGCGFNDLDQLKELCEFVKDSIEEYIAEKPETDYDFVIAPDGSGDVEIDEKLFIDFVDELALHKPYGRGFELPRILLRFDANDAGWRIIGSDNTHLKITLPAGFDILCWNQADFLDNGIPTGMIEISGNLDINEFRGTRSAQFIGDIIRS